MHSTTRKGVTEILQLVLYNIVFYLFCLCFALLKTRLLQQNLTKNILKIELFLWKIVKIFEPAGARLQTPFFRWILISLRRHPDLTHDPPSLKLLPTPLLAAG